MLILLLALFANPAFAHDSKGRLSIDEYKKMDPEQRRESFRSTTREIDPDDFFDLFILGIKDPDSMVRRNAIGKLAFIMGGLQTLKREKKSIPLKMTKIGELQDLLIATLSDPDAQTRGAAVWALAFSGAPSAKIESALLNRLVKEPNEQIKAGIIETMGRAGYESSAYIQVLRKSLFDSSTEVSNAAATAICESKPPDMLPTLAQGIKKNRNSVYLELQAMAAYGAEALPYLEKLAADSTLPEFSKKRITETIAALKNPAPEAAETPRQKAVSLFDDRGSNPPASKQSAPVPPTAVPTPLRQGTGDD